MQFNDHEKRIDPRLSIAEPIDDAAIKPERLARMVLLVSDKMDALDKAIIDNGIAKSRDIKDVGEALHDDLQGLGLLSVNAQQVQDRFVKYFEQKLQIGGRG